MGYGYPYGLGRHRRGAGGTPAPTVRTLVIGNKQGTPSVSTAGSPLGGQWTGSAPRGLSMRTRHEIAEITGGVTNIRQAWCTYYEHATTGQTALGNSIDMHSALEMSGAYYEFLKGGSDAPYTIPDATPLVLTDPLAGFSLTGAGGEIIYSRHNPTVPLNGRLALGLGIANTGGWYYRNGQLTGTPSAGTDIVEGTGTSGFGAQGNVMQPLCFIGDVVDPHYRAWGIIEYSTGCGEGDPGFGAGADPLAYRGWIERGLGSTFGWLQMSKGASTLSQFRASGMPVALAIAPYLTDIIIGKAGNDFIQLGRTLAQAQADAIWIANALLAVNPLLRIWLRTEQPYTSSTDGWLTIANQSIPGTTNTKRLGWNQWDRDGCPMIAGAAVAPGTGGSARFGEIGNPFHGYFDPAAEIEADASNVITLDGGYSYCPGGGVSYYATQYHLSPAGALAASDAIDAPALRLAA